MRSHKIAPVHAADLCHNRLHQPRGIRRRRRLQHAQISRLRNRTDLARRRLDKAHVRHPLVILGFLIRRLHRDDKHICRLRLRRKVQPTRGKRLRQRILQARLDDVDFPAAQLVDDLLLHIKPADLEARQRKRNCRRQTDVAAAHNFNLLHWEAPFPVDYRL